MDRSPAGRRGAQSNQCYAEDAAVTALDARGCPGNVSERTCVHNCAPIIARIGAVAYFVLPHIIKISGICGNSVRGNAACDPATPRDVLQQLVSEGHIASLFPGNLRA